MGVSDIPSDRRSCFQDFDSTALGDSGYGVGPPLSGRAGESRAWYFSNPRAHGCRERFVDDVPRIQDTRRLQHNHLGLFVGSSAMLDATGHDDKLARPQFYIPVPELESGLARPKTIRLRHCGGATGKSPAL